MRSQNQKPFIFYNIAVAFIWLVVLLTPLAIVVPTAVAQATPPPDITAPSNREEVKNCSGTNDAGEVDQAKLKDCLSKNPIVNLFNAVINFLAVGVGVVTVIMVIVGGIQYTTAGGNPQAVAAARKRIVNAVIAFIAFLFIYSFMQWLIPGGLF